MKRILLTVLLVLSLTGIAFANSQSDPTSEATATATATASPVITVSPSQSQSNVMGNTGINYGSVNSPAANASTGAITNNNTATIQTGAVKVDNKNTNTNFNTNLNSNDNKNTNINEGNKQKQGQEQGQSQVNEGNTVSIVNERALLAIPTAGVPEVNFGAGKMDWNFGTLLPKVGITVLTSNDVVKEVLDTTANIKAKNLLPTLLKMKKAQMPLCYNVRLIIIKAEAQKSWTTGGSMSGGGSGISPQGVGSAAGASLVPSFGGTKADDLYTAILVKIE